MADKTFGDKLIDAGSSAILDSIAGGGLFSVAGSILGGYMNAKDEEDRFKREMALREKEFNLRSDQFSHQMDMDFKSSARADEQMKIAKKQDARVQNQYLNAAQKDAQDQEMKMSQLRILNSRY